MKFPDVRIVIGSWLVIMSLVIGMFAFNSLNNDANLKHKVLRWYMVLGGVAIGWWFFLLGGIQGLLAAIVLSPVSALIAWRTTRFCDACGKTLMNQFTKAKFCPRCGADLDAQDENRRMTSS